MGRNSDLENLEKEREKINAKIRELKKRESSHMRKKRNHNIFLAFGYLNKEEKLFSQMELQMFSSNEIFERVKRYKLVLKEENEIEEKNEKSEKEEKEKNEEKEKKE